MILVTKHCLVKPSLHPLMQPVIIFLNVLILRERIFLTARCLCQAENSLEISKGTDCILSYLRKLINIINCGYVIRSSAADD